MQTFIFFILIVSSTFAVPAQSATFSNMIHCEKWMSLDTDCVVKSQELVGVQQYHSEFRISYDMSCDSGAKAAKPSPLTIQVQGPNSELQETSILFKTKTSFVVTGIGPVKLINTNPKSFSGQKFNAGCQLKITVDPYISQQTVNQLTDFIEDTRSQIAGHLEKLAIYQSRMIAEVGAEPSFACLIHNYESNPTYAELLFGLILELKNTYQLNFNRPYLAGQFTCPWSESIESRLAECEAVSIHAHCAFYTLYLQERTWLTERLQTASDWLAVLSDINARNELEKIEIELQTALLTIESGIF